MSDFENIKLRKEFEAAAVERISESGFTEIEIRTECLMRCGDGYQDEVINAGWHYWQRGIDVAIERANARHGEQIARHKRLYKKIMRRCSQLNAKLVKAMGAKQ